jgi:hypothetical protein
MRTNIMRRRAVAIAAALVAAAGLITAATAATPTAAPQATAAPQTAGNVVLDWFGYAGRELNQAAVGRNQPPRARLEQAMVQGAVYDAVNAITRDYQPYISAPPAKRWYSQAAAAATAAYRVLVALLPYRQAAIRPLYDKSLADIPAGAAKNGGIGVGVEAANAMLAARQNDGRDGPRNPVLSATVGQWRPTPPKFAVTDTAWIADVRPFLITDPRQLRTGGPNALESAAYAGEFNETKAYGAADSTVRTPEQTNIALYWNDAPWAQIPASLATSQRLSLADTARMLAMVMLAGADAEITVVNEKNYWNSWRPITAIQEAAYDGNPATTPDPDWTPLIETPGFPEFPAGHTTGSGAIVGTLQNFFGTDRMQFSAFNPATGTTRNFTSFSQALQEVIDSRVWGGIHWRRADVVGAQLGTSIAQIEAERYLKPLEHS